MVLFEVLLGSEVGLAPPVERVDTMLVRLRWRCGDEYRKSSKLVVVDRMTTMIVDESYG